MATAIREGWQVATNVSKLAGLPKPGDPYVDSRGVEWIPDLRPGEHTFTPLADISPGDFRPVSRRSIVDLPTQEKAMRGVAVIYVYTMLGLTDQEISECVGATPQEIREFRQNKAYVETFEAIANELISTNAGLLKSRVAGYAHEAVEAVTDIMRRGKNEAVRLSAAKDVLDRSGVKHADEARNAGMNELRIRIVSADDELDVDVSLS